MYMLYPIGRFFHPWMADVHEWNATYIGAPLAQIHVFPIVTKAMGFNL